MGNLPKLLVTISLTVLPLALGCRKPTTTTPTLVNLPTTYGPRGANDLVVAKVNGLPIYQSDVQRQAQAEGVSAKLALESLLTLEALASYARNLPWAQGREAQRGAREVLAQAYVQRELEPQLQLHNVPESLLRQAYERTRPAYVHPRLVRVAIFQYHLSKKTPPEQRTQARAWMNEIAAWVKRPENRSLDAWSELSKQQQWIDRQVLFGVNLIPEGEAYSETLNRAIHAMSNPKEVTDLIEDMSGLTITMYLGERSASNVSFDEAKPKIADALFEPWRQRRFLELTDALARKAGVQIVANAVPPAK